MVMDADVFRAWLRSSLARAAMNNLDSDETGNQSSNQRQRWNRCKWIREPMISQSCHFAKTPMAAPMHPADERVTENANKKL